MTDKEGSETEGGAAPVCGHPAWWAMTYKRPAKYGRHVLVDRIVCVECSEVRPVPTAARGIQ